MKWKQTRIKNILYGKVRELPSRIGNSCFGHVKYLGRMILKLGQFVKKRKLN